MNKKAFKIAALMAGLFGLSTATSINPTTENASETSLNEEPKILRMNLKKGKINGVSTKGLGTLRDLNRVAE
jgi:Na+/H+-translocating membrane pyrophosphatase